MWTFRPARSDSHASTASASSMSSGRCIFGGADAHLIELLQRRLQYLGLARGRWPPGSVASSTRSTTRPPRMTNTWIAPPARTHLESEHVAVAELRRCHLLLPVAQRLHRPQRVAQLRRLLVSFAPRRPSSSCVRSVSSSSSLRPSSSSFVVRHGLAVPFSSQQISATHGAMQRLMSYSRHGRPRCPVITSLHDRIPNSRCVSAIVLRASLAGRNGPA